MLLATALLLPVALVAQSEGRDDAPHVHTVSGRVLQPGDDGLVPVRGLWVVLHRLGSDHAGPLDSIRTDARGAYRFRYTLSGDERAIYFAAASYGGVAYFAPLAGHAVAGEAAEIVVFDTTSAEIPITVRGRHLVVSGATPDARRSVMEIYELSNDTTVTRVSPGPQSPPTWRTALPAAASDFQVAAGDVPVEAVSFDGGEMRLVAPLPPGVKQVAYSYSLPASAFPLSVPSPDSTDVLEILIEDPSGAARGPQLVEVAPVTVEGRNFRRFLAQDVPAGTVNVVDIPRVTTARDTRYMVGITLLVGGAMLLALARAFRRG